MATAILDNCITVPNFMVIGQTVAEIRRFFYFSKMMAVRHLGFVMRMFGPPRRAFGGLYCSARFGWNRCSSFDNMHVFSFHEFGLKTPIHVPKLEFGGFDPLNGEPYQQNPKRPILRHLSHHAQKSLNGFDL